MRGMDGGAPRDAMTKRGNIPKMIPPPSQSRISRHGRCERSRIGGKVAFSLTLENSESHLEFIIGPLHCTCDKTMSRFGAIRFPRHLPLPPILASVSSLARTAFVSTDQRDKSARCRLGRETRSPPPPPPLRKSTWNGNGRRRRRPFGVLRHQPTITIIRT